MPVSVCANLPYYITAPILMHLLESRAKLETITVMVQKEVAEKLTAPVGTREAGAITVAVQYYGTVTQLFSVSRGSFAAAECRFCGDSNSVGNAVCGAGCR